jgi:hypothetical protein
MIHLFHFSTKTRYLKIYLLGLIFIYLLSIGYGQDKLEPVKLKYKENVIKIQNLEPRKTDEKTKGTIQIQFKYRINSDRSEEIEMILSPKKEEPKDMLVILDKGGQCMAVRTKYETETLRAKKKDYLSVSSELEDKDLEPFYSTKNFQNALVLKTPFNTGVMKITTGESTPIIFRVNLERKTNRNIELWLNLYYGTKKVNLSLELTEIKLNLILPEEEDYCSYYDQEQSNLEGKVTPISKFENEYSTIISKNKIEILEYISEIEFSKGQLIEYQKLSDRIDNDPIKGFCGRVNSLSIKIKNFIDENTATKYDEFIGKLNNKIKELEVIETKEKEVVQTKQETKKEPSQIKEEAPVVVQTKKGKPEVSCDELIKSAVKELNFLNVKFTKEALYKQISDINLEIESLRVNAAKTSGTDLNIGQLNNSTGKIVRENNNIGERLGYYEKEINWLLRELKDRPECKNKELSEKVKEFNNTIDKYREQCTLINREIDELSSGNEQSKLLKEELKHLYSPLFTKLLKSFISMDSTITSFSKLFKSEKNSGKYYSKDKKQYLERLSDFDATYNKLNASFDSLNSAADADFNAKLDHPAIWSESTRENKLQIEQIGSSVSNQITKLKKDINDSIPDKFPWILIISGFFGAIIIIFGARVYYNAFKKRKSKQMVNIGRYAQPQPVKKPGRNEPGPANGMEDWPESQKVGGITITRVVNENKLKQPTEAGKGLDHVIPLIGIDYKEIDLSEYWQDTLVGKVFIHRSAIKKTYKFFLESCSNPDKVLETGGYLIGGWEIDKEDPNKYNVSFEDFIEPGDDAIYGEYQLNFGAKIGVRLEKVIQNYREKMGKEFTLTSWFHSHPAIKIFLSNHDLDVQERLSSQEHKYKLLALVIDPITQEDNMSFLTGIFSYKSNGTMNNNAGNLKMINWKHMYEWAISAVPPSIKDFYPIEMEPLCNNSNINTIYLNDKCITRFSLFLDDLQNNPNAQGFFKGEVINKDVHGKELVFFKDFIEAQDNHITDGHDVVGSFFFTDDPESKIADLQEQKEKLNHTEVIVFCDNFSKELFIITRKEDKNFILKEDIKKTVSFSEIESWPTRRR